MPLNTAQTPPCRLMESDKILYFGSSMYPTLHDFDIIQFSAYGKDDVRVGDIVVFPSPNHSEIKIIHRVISVERSSIRTKGDNCPIPDSWTLSRSDILGYGVKIWRDGNEHTISSIVPREIWYRYVRILNKIRYYSMHFLTAPYNKISESRIVSRFTTHLFTQSMVQFQGTFGRELQLHLGRMTIGRLREGEAAWKIRPPFKILVDETKLPTLVDS